MQAAPERVQRALEAVVGVPQLRRHEELLAGDPALLDRRT